MDNKENDQLVGSNLDSEKTKEYGSKAFNLFRMIKAGLPVPRGWVVSLDNLESLDPLINLAVFEYRALAIRSCVPQEDLAGSALAGAFKSFLNVTTIGGAIEALASIRDQAKAKGYTANAIIQAMTSRWPKYSGVAYTIDPDCPEDRMIVSWSEYQEEVTSGRSLQGFQYYPRHDTLTSKHHIPVATTKLLGPLLKAHREFGPVDIEWCIDTHGGVAFVQMRSLVEHLEGYWAGPTKTVKGPTLVFKSLTELQTFGGWKEHPGCVLVVPNSDPSVGQLLVNQKDRIMGIVADHGTHTCHTALVARQLKIPAVLGVRWGTQVLESGQAVKIKKSGQDCGIVTFKE